MKIKPNTIPAHAPALPQDLAIAISSSSQYSQGATIGGPLKSRGPLRFSCPTSHMSNCSPAPLSRRLVATLDIDAKTKGDQGIMIPLEISLIPLDRSTDIPIGLTSLSRLPQHSVPSTPHFFVPPAILTQYQKVATCHPKKWQPSKKLAIFVFSSKTKGAQMLTKKVSTFEKCEHLSILTQYRASPAIS